MIKDFNEFRDGSLLEADICIVGAGAAGITMAREFACTRHEVLVLESGGFGSETQTQQLYDSEVVGLPHTGIHSGRARVFGGTTTLWGGQALRLNSLDLQERSWVPFSGWPISRQELDPFYDRADRVLHLSSRISYENLCASYGIAPPEFDSSQLEVICSQWSPKPDFGTTYRRELHVARNVSVLLHANVTSINAGPDGAIVESVEFKTLFGKTGTVRARLYVICCGGIETARLLLASNRIEPRGLGNRNDLVGRFFQEHIHIQFGVLEAKDRALLQECFESFYVRGLKHAPLIALSEQRQVKDKLLSIHGTIGFEAGPDSSIMAAKTIFRAFIGRNFSNPRELGRLARRALAGPGEMARLAYRLYIQKRAGTPKSGPIILGAQSEMAPNPNSRVSLGESRDPLGMQRVKLDWQLGELERRTMLEYVRTLARELKRLGLGTFDLSQVASLEDPSKWVLRAHDSAHHMGTARMHDTPQLGVVDRDCKVHGTSNLYIASSAVFPTCAHSNPTLTILALCLRLADRIKQLI